MDLGMHLRLGTVNRPLPSMALDFLTEPVLSSTVTFARSSAATRVGQDGLIQTVAVDAPRFDFDPVSRSPRGLLIEEARTNLLVNSPVSGVVLPTQSVSVTAVPHTISFYGTGTVTLSGAVVATVIGSGAYPNRQVLTFTPILGVLVCTVVGLVQFAQLEVGGFATSFIPTAASPVARSADVATMAGANFSSWYNQTEGTFIANFDTLEAGTASAIRYVLAMDSSASKRVIFIDTASEAAASFDGATTVTATGDVSGPISKVASAYNGSGRALVSNGGTVATGTIAAGYATATSLNIGGLGTSNLFNGHIRSLKYYRARFANAKLQALSA